MKNKKDTGVGDKGNTLPLKQQPPRKQLLNKRAEEYMRESGNIEDMPDPEQDQEAEKQLKKNKSTK